MRRRFLLTLLLLPCLAVAAQASVFGRKKDKVIDPKQRVPDLINTLKADKDADNRARAAEELRNYDAGTFPGVVPALIDALQHDAKPNVRLDAAQSLGKVRPVSQAAADALEQAQANDSSMRVRLQARTALLQYHWAGYKSGKKTDVPPLTPSGKEPPLISTTKPPVKVQGPSTKEPPLAAPLPAPTPAKKPATTEGPDLP